MAVLRLLAVSYERKVVEGVDVSIELWRWLIHMPSPRIGLTYKAFCSRDAHWARFSASTNKSGLRAVYTVLGKKEKGHPLWVAF